MSAIDDHQRPSIERYLREITPELMEAARPNRKLADSGDKTASKMWILPSGTTVSLDAWHWQWLKSNLDVADRFEIGDKVRAIAATDEEAGRIVALKAGFFRVNYEKGNGVLTIEGCSRYWRNSIKDAVFMLVADNASSIDSISVTLFDDAIRRIEKQGCASLFSYTSADKINHIPLVSESARGKALRIILASKALS